MSGTSWRGQSQPMHRKEGEATRSATNEAASDIGVHDKDLIGVSLEDGIAEVVQSTVIGRKDTCEGQLRRAAGLLHDDEPARPLTQPCRDSGTRACSYGQLQRQLQRILHVHEGAIASAPNREVREVCRRGANEWL